MTYASKEPGLYIVGGGAMHGNWRGWRMENVSPTKNLSVLKEWEELGFTQVAFEDPGGKLAREESGVWVGLRSSSIWCK